MRVFACALAISLVASAPAHAAPRRVASLNLCTDELLLQLADPGQIVSVTWLAQQTHETPLWRRARHYAANDGSLMSVVRHRPDLVIGMGGGGRDAGRIARRLGIGTLDLAFPMRTADVEEMVRTVAAALGRRSSGQALLDRIARLRRNAPSRAIDTVWLGGGGRSLAATGLGAEWMALAGLQQRRLVGDRLSLEQLIARPPAILLRSDYRHSQYSSEQTWLAHPLVAGRRSTRSLSTDGRLWTCMGPLMVDEIERLRRAAR